MDQARNCLCSIFDLFHSLPVIPPQYPLAIHALVFCQLLLFSIRPSAETRLRAPAYFRLHRLLPGLHFR